MLGQYQKNVHAPREIERYYTRLRGATKQLATGWDRIPLGMRRSVEKTTPE